MSERRYPNLGDVLYQNRLIPSDQPVRPFPALIAQGLTLVGGNDRRVYTPEADAEYGRPYVLASMQFAGVLGELERPVTPGNIKRVTDSLQSLGDCRWRKTLPAHNIRVVRSALGISEIDLAALDMLFQNGGDKRLVRYFEDVGEMTVALAKVLIGEAAVRIDKAFKDQKDNS